MRSILFHLLFGILLGTLNAGAQQASLERPNVLVIMVDQWRGQALGLEGKEPVHTPNLDALGKSGFVSTQMISNHPLCSPARAMFMTGCYSMGKTKVYSNANSLSARYGIELPATAICWSDILKGSGYSNGYIGKWHLDSPVKPYIPCSNNNDSIAWNEWTAPEKRHGFDYWYAYGTYDKHLRPMYWDTKADRDGFRYVDEWGPQHEATKAIAFLKNDGGRYRDPAKPFALMISMNPPHSPYDEVPDHYRAKYKDTPLEQLVKDPNIPSPQTEMGREYHGNIKDYYAMIYGVDEQIGRILKHLETTGLDRNTIVIFTSDHGNCLGKHDEISKNNMYEESLRIPLIISWKGHIKPEINHNILPNIPDIYPTLLQLVGLGDKIPALVEGKSLASYLLNGNDIKPENQFFLATVQRSNPNSGLRGVRSNHYKLVYTKKDGKIKPSLFDLQKDPFELKNIFKEDHQAVAPLKRSLKKWLQYTNDPYILE